LAHVASVSHDFENAHVIREHFHPEDQLIFASKGVMTIHTQEGICHMPDSKWLFAIALSPVIAMPSAMRRSGVSNSSSAKRAASIAITRRSFRTTISTSSVCTSIQAFPTESGRTANQALIGYPAIADGDFNVNGHFSDDPDTTRDGNFCRQTIPPGLWRTK
jgi:hypothetical protein